jgi:hypothetical protein
MLKKHLDKPAHQIGKREAEAFAVIAKKTLTGRTAKERVCLLHSAWEWATDKYQVAPVNPSRIEICQGFLHDAIAGRMLLTSQK